MGEGEPVKKPIALIPSAAILLGVLALFLVAMVGLFWVLEILPLVALLGVVVYYAVMSSKAPHTRDR